MNSRRQKLLKGISKEMNGLEIAPWFAPIAPKSEGYNVKVLDFFPKDELVPRALADSNIPTGAERNIEDVDFVGNASAIADLTNETFDYLISSHNFEHIPDPIRFLQGVERVLKPGGMLIMALPDCRYTFDRYRTHTLIGEWLAAYKENRTEPTPKQIFEFFAYMGSNASAEIPGDLLNSYKKWDRDEYTDVHCTLFFPESFELLMLEAQILGLTSLEVIKVVPRLGEFFVWAQLGKSTSGNIDNRRKDLLRKIKRKRSARPDPIVRASSLFDAIFDRLIDQII